MSFSSFTNFGSGNGLAFCGKYLEFAPDERVRYTEKFGDPNFLGELRGTAVLINVSCGTESRIVQEGVPKCISVEMGYLGSQESLAPACYSGASEHFGITGAYA